MIVNPKVHKASDYFIKTEDRNGKDLYVVITELWYYSYKYGKWIVCNVGDISDGATGAYDINSFAWLFHDDLCNTGTFQDGTPCTNWQASCIVSEILDLEGRYIRTKTWKYATFIFGGGKARDNGMFKLTA